MPRIGRITTMSCAESAVLEKLRRLGETTPARSVERGGKLDPIALSKSKSIIASSASMAFSRDPAVPFSSSMTKDFALLGKANRRDSRMLRTAWAFATFGPSLWAAVCAKVFNSISKSCTESSSSSSSSAGSWAAASSLSSGGGAPPKFRATDTMTTTSSRANRISGMWRGIAFCKVSFRTKSSCTRASSLAVTLEPKPSQSPSTLIPEAGLKTPASREAAVQAVTKTRATEKRRAMSFC
mmetsp:Transcript_85728/g.154368  ORF Transcript_85728/g.154368 Transcript_85728/m.154368 type:complete len:240 (+) Transcript_85728:1349-2068(+)